ncbi:MAG TPA: phosphoribosyl-ATP diphosphatase [Hyphomicrobiaceae bacterium]|nr:phosphoribosyl-ATP diphosphatase [Hyphomicrobiaceae bacterium]
MSDEVLARLAALIRSRRSAGADQSYTRQLLDAGLERCARKFGEEAVETLVAALAEDDAALRAEAADLIYHLMVLLEVRNIAFEDVVRILAGRMGTSGLAEKAQRKP